MCVCSCFILYKCSCNNPTIIHITTYIDVCFHLSVRPSNLSLICPQAEALFFRLNQAIIQFKEWVVLGSHDLDALVDKSCKSVTDWERNFRALKIRGRDAEKLPK